jgi:hypothetical protein
VHTETLFFWRAGKIEPSGWRAAKYAFCHLFFLEIRMSNEQKGANHVHVRPCAQCGCGGVEGLTFTANKFFGKL